MAPRGTKEKKVDLSEHQKHDYGRGFIVRGLWYLVNTILFRGYAFPLYSPKVFILHVFGACMGKNTVIKPNVNIKYPWKLKIGDNVWIGEGVWIDNLDYVTIGDNVCISQGVYLCTGSHDYRDEKFRLITKPIKIEEGAWLCAFSKIAPGVTVKRNSVVGFWSVLTDDTVENKVYVGNPAKSIRERF